MKKPSLGLWFIIAAGALYRLAFIGKPIAGDEVGAACWYFRLPVPIIMNDYRMPKNHIFQSILTHLSGSIFGYRNLGVRLPVLLAGVALIGLVYWLAIELTDDNEPVALMAAGMTALSGYLVTYSASARGYEIQALLVVLTMLIVRRWHDWESGEEVYTAALAVAGFLLLYTLPAGIIFLVPLYIGLAWINDRWSRQMLAMAALLTVALTAIAYGPLWYNLKSFSAGAQGAIVCQNPGAFVQEILVEMSRGILPVSLLCTALIFGMVYCPTIGFIIGFHLTVALGLYRWFPFVLFLPRNYGILFPLVYLLASYCLCEQAKAFTRWRRYAFYALFGGGFILSASYELAYQILDRKMPFETLHQAHRDCRILASAYGPELKPGDYFRGLGACDGVGQWYADLETPPGVLGAKIHRVFVVSPDFQETLRYWRQEIGPRFRSPRCFARVGLATLCLIE